MSEFDPVEGSLGQKRPMDDRFPPDVVSVPPTLSKKVEREGLPPSYRMRADAHYVDQLTTRRADRADRVDNTTRGADTREPHREVRAEAHDFQGLRSDRLLTHIAQEAAALESAAGMLSHETSALARRVGVDLIRAHALRSAWLARACALLAGTHRAQIRPHQVGVILAEAHDRYAAACRLSGARLDVQASDWNMVSCDRPAIVTAIGAGLFATLALVGEGEGLPVRVTVVVAEGDLQQIDIAQDDVTVAGPAAERFLDPAWADRPGGWFSDVAVNALRVVAERTGGQARLILGERRGSLLRLTFGR